LFTSILAFAGSATNAPAAAAAPNARRDFSTSGSGALDGLRAAAEATRTKKQRIDAAVRREDKLQGQQSESNLHNNSKNRSPAHPGAVRNSRMQRRSISVPWGAFWQLRAQTLPSDM
jgi:phage repressor protein C with HTH and peptisase S24 domain